MEETREQIMEKLMFMSPNAYLTICGHAVHRLKDMKHWRVDSNYKTQLTDTLSLLGFKVPTNGN
jgi:hypothetical protein